MRFKSYAIIPAAGHSLRMGAHKLLIEIGPLRLIERVLSAWVESDVDCVVAVIRPGDSELADCCRTFPVEIVEASDPPADMRESLEIGISYLEGRFAPKPSDAWLVAPGDQAGLSALVIDQLLSAYAPDYPEVLVPAVHGTLGHPVLLPWSKARDLSDLPKDLGLNSLVRRSAYRTVSSTDSKILTDLDTPDDLAEWRRSFL